MIKVPNGVLFEVKKNLPHQGHYSGGNGKSYPMWGIKESFKSIGYGQDGRYKRIKLEFGVEYDGAIKPPCFYDATNGIIPLSMTLTGVAPKANFIYQSLKEFSRGNRAIYSAVPYLVCVVTGKIDSVEKKWVENPSIEYYLPRGIKMLDVDGNGNVLPYLVTQLFTDKSQYDSVQMPNMFVGANKEGLKEYLSLMRRRLYTNLPIYLVDKEYFWTYRILGLINQTSGV